MKDLIEKHIQHCIETKSKLLANYVSQIEQAGMMLVECLKRGNKVLFMGNGGSASDSQHLAAELVGRFEKERAALPAIALTTDCSILTAVANDYAYERVFERQVEALGKAGDVIVGISTSGKSANINKAMKVASIKGLETIAFTGKDGGELKDLVDLALIMPSSSTACIQECHIMIGQILCRMVDEAVSAPIVQY